MGYPAAFTNTVLKGSMKQITKDVKSGDPRNVGKVAVTALSMVQVARIMNDWRSDGKSEENGAVSANFQAVKRIGGLGILADNITKGYDATKYSGSVLGYGTMPFGPLATDALSIGRRGITPTLVRKIPAALSPVQKILGIVDEEAAENFKADMDHFIYEADKNISEFEQGFIPDFEPDGGLLAYATGGIVEDVPNVSTEPDERINKITGLPYNESAGTAYMDVEDRAKFSGGGEVSLVNEPSLREAEDVKFIENNQMEIDPDGAVQYGIEDSLLDLSQDDTSNKGASDIFSTMSEAMSSAKVAVLKQLGYSPSNIDEVLAKLPKTEPQYEEAVIRNVLSKQRVTKQPTKLKTYYGKDAVNKVIQIEGKLNSLQEYVVREEGFVDGNYLDTKNIVTSGVGQTGKYKNMTFKEVFKIHQEEAKRYVPKFDSLSEKQQKALMSLVYRGDLQKSPTFRDRVNEGNFEQAAIELLDHKEYREYKRIAKEGGDVSGIIGRLEEASEFIKG
jgi:GH24 family phage-related lysozyme (muramidase)